MYSLLALLTAPGVSVRPGATALQRIPRVPYWEATDFVSSTTPALEAPYAARTPRPTNPSIDAVFTIEPPPRASMRGIACLQPRNWPLRLTATSRSKTAMSSVTMSVSTALVEESVALLCNTSRPPNDSTAVSTMRTTLGSSETSTSAATALRSSPATRSASVPLMSATTTEAPSRAIRRAVASPMPLPAPVTIATLPSRRPIEREYVSGTFGLPAREHASRLLEALAIVALATSNPDRRLEFPILRFALGSDRANLNTSSDTL